jgi:FdhD protein
MADVNRGSVRTMGVVRVGPDKHEPRGDLVAVEEPLEIRLQGSTFIVTMRTPGADRELAAGFLLSERIIRGADDIGTIRHCTSPGPKDPPYEARETDISSDDPTSEISMALEKNILDVTLIGDAASRVAETIAGRRLVATSSACGVCGRQSVDDLMREMPRIDASWSAPAKVIAGLPARLREAQAVFDETGGLHAAGLFDPEGRLIAIAEDVGRHNAVDKVVGSQLLLDRLPLSDRILFVSGRTSFEIVQKAVAAGIPVVAAVSAPSSLAIELARDAGVTLAGFVRGDAFNVYANPQRIAGTAT